MTEREKLVLSAIVNYYLTYGDTVGSRALVKKYGIDFSSATIRNVMSDLEDEGYIAKTHISSGRIPTDKGYRYYLDELLEIEKLTKIEQENIEQTYKKRMEELDSILQQTSALLSKMTTYAGLVTEPDYKKNKIKKIELVHLDDYLVMAVIVMENKAVRTKQISLDSRLTRDEVVELSNHINEKIISGEITDIDINDIFKEENIEEKRGFNLEHIEEAIRKELYIDMEGKFFLNNASSLIASEEVEHAAEVMKVFDNNRNIKSIFEEMVNLREKNYGSVNVIFGDELNIKGLENYSFVYSLYRIGDSEGIVGVIGPKRMAYSKTIGLVDHVTKEVNKVIDKIKREDGK